MQCLEPHASSIATTSPLPHALRGGKRRFGPRVCLTAGDLLRFSLKQALHSPGGQSTRLLLEELDEDASPGVVESSRFMVSRFMATGTVPAAAASSLTVALFSSLRQYVTLASAMDSAVSWTDRSEHASLRRSFSSAQPRRPSGGVDDLTYFDLVLHLEFFNFHWKFLF